MKKTTLLAAIAGLSFSGSVMADVFAFIEMPLTPSQEAVNAPLLPLLPLQAGMAG